MGQSFDVNSTVQLTAVALVDHTWTTVHSGSRNTGYFRGSTIPNTSASQLWYLRLDPSEHAFAEDQEPPSSRTCLSFKANLIANAARTSPVRQVLDRNLPCIKELDAQSPRVWSAFYYKIMLLTTLAAIMAIELV